MMEKYAIQKEVCDAVAELLSEIEVPLSELEKVLVEEGFQVVENAYPYFVCNSFAIFVDINGKVIDVLARGIYNWYDEWITIVSLKSLDEDISKLTRVIRRLSEKC